MHVNHPGVQNYSFVKFFTIIVKRVIRDFQEWILQPFSLPTIRRSGI